MPSVCAPQAGTLKYKPLAEGCRIGSPPEAACGEKRCLTRMIPPIPGLWATYTHRNCTCNEYVALRNRVLGAVPRPTKSGLRELRAEAQIIGRQLPKIAPMARSHFVDHYTGKRRERYRQAMLSLEERPLLLPKEAAIEAFVKSEKFNPDAKVNPDPRMIQARNARFNLEIGLYLKPIEHHLYRLTNPSGRPLLAKGLTPWRRGEVIREMWEARRNPCAVSIDGSRWDQHVDKSVLRIEHDVYRCCNSDQWFSTLLDCQLVNKGRTQGRWKYVAKGKRMSGDMNTALGNCLLMVLMARSCLKKLDIEGEIFDDGDDCLLIIEREDLERLQKNIGEIFLNYGQEVKLENIATVLEDVEFCQARPVRMNDNTMSMVANWRKIISQSTSGTRYWHEHETRKNMAFSIGQCLFALYPGVPIIQQYAQKLCEQGTFSREVINTDWIWKVQPTGRTRDLGQLGPEPITPDTRNSFARAFGVSPLQQVAIERQLEQWQLPEGTETATSEVSGEWNWEVRLGHSPMPWDWSLDYSQVPTLR